MGGRFSRIALAYRIPVIDISTSSFLTNPRSLSTQIQKERFGLCIDLIVRPFRIRTNFFM